MDNDYNDNCCVEYNHNICPTWSWNGTTHTNFYHNHNNDAMKQRQQQDSPHSLSVLPEQKHHSKHTHTHTHTHTQWSAVWSKAIVSHYYLQEHPRQCWCISSLFYEIPTYYQEKK